MNFLKEENFSVGCCYTLVFYYFSFIRFSSEKGKFLFLRVKSNNKLRVELRGKSEKKGTIFPFSSFEGERKTKRIFQVSKCNESFLLRRFIFDGAKAFHSFFWTFIITTYVYVPVGENDKNLKKMMIFVVMRQHEIPKQRFFLFIFLVLCLLYWKF